MCTISQIEIVSDDDPRKFVPNIERTAVSRQEIDISAAHILNRLEINLVASQTDHVNPGIASIWKDEKVRRSRQPNANHPPLEIPQPEHRPMACATESDLFYREALITKLKESEDSQPGDESTTQDLTLLNGSVLNETKNKFHLRQLLANSVYPAECSQQSSGSLLNASLVLNHRYDGIARQCHSRASNAFNSMCLDYTLVDEEIVNSLSQKQSQRHSAAWADVSCE